MIAITAITCLFFSLSSSNANTQSITHENCICGGFISNGHNYIGDIGQSWQRRMGDLPKQSSSKQFIDKNGKGGYTFLTNQFQKKRRKHSKEQFKNGLILLESTGQFPISQAIHLSLSKICMVPLG